MVRLVHKSVGACGTQNTVCIRYTKIVCAVHKTSFSHENNVRNARPCPSHRPPSGLCIARSLVPFCVPYLGCCSSHEQRREACAGISLFVGSYSDVQRVPRRLLSFEGWRTVGWRTVGCRLGWGGRTVGGMCRCWGLADVRWPISLGGLADCSLASYAEMGGGNNAHSKSM